MQIGAGASAGRPVSAESLAKGDPAASSALRYIRDERRAPAGALGTAAPRRATAPASASLAAAGQCAASFPPGVREGGRIRARAFRPQRPPPPRPPPPAPRGLHTGGFPLGRGRPRHFYITIGRCALGTRFLVVEAPAGPHLHPVPGPPAPRPGALPELWARISLITYWPLQSSRDVLRYSQPPLGARGSQQALLLTPHPPWAATEPTVLHSVPQGSVG